MSVGVAILLMIAACISVHLGLPQAIAAVVTKVCKCHKCLSFWVTLLGLLWYGTPLLHAVLLSVFAAWLSNWFALLVIMFNKIYEDLWERLNK